jgi:phage gp29-like protein
MPRIIDQHGNPIDSGVLKEPQTSRIAQLHNEMLASALGGLTPTRLAATLRDADNGNLVAQHRLFADMEERDGHLRAEIEKRRGALTVIDWDIVPPKNANAAEKAAAEWVAEVLRDAVDPIEDLLLALMEAVGHGFGAVELEWRREGRELLPAFNPRPQEWFCLDRSRTALRLRDNSAYGAELAPFGWVLHTAGKAKNGYGARLGLHRTLSWPFIYKAYALGDFAEYLETFGLPIIVGKYYQGASADEKSSLMRAVTALGHDARAIMPADMQLEIQKITGGGTDTPHLAMVEWVEKSQSKCILGQTLTTDTGSGGGGSYALGKVHAEVRGDILRADARQLAATLTRDLVYPLIAINRGGIDGLRRCPQFRFDLGETEDLVAYADALPKLVGAGLRSIPVAWVHEKLRIPEPAEGEAVLGGEPIGEPLANALANPGKNPGSPGSGQVARLSASLAGLATATPAHAPDQIALDTAATDVIGDLAAVGQDFIGPVLDAVMGAADYADAFERLAELWPQLDSLEIERRLGNALCAAEAWGRLSAKDGQ